MCTLRNVWFESSAPGIIFAGQPRLLNEINFSVKAFIILTAHKFKERHKFSMFTTQCFAHQHIQCYILRHLEYVNQVSNFEATFIFLHLPENAHN